MKIAYLINQYPQPSHTFIRREIVALEALGFSVARFSLRQIGGGLLDPADVQEQAKTRSILGEGPSRLLLALAAAAFARPVRFLRALRLAVVLAGRAQGSLLRHLAYLAEGARLRELLAAEGAVHLHAHFGTNPAAVAMLCHELGGPRYSFTVHGPEEFDRAPLLALDEKIRRAEFVIAVSNFGRSQLCRLTPPEQWGKLFVVRCGVGGEFFSAPAPCPPTQRLVCVARLSEQKGHLVLLDALQRLTSQDVPVEVVLIGDGPMRPIVEQRIRDLHLGSVVSLAGWVDERTVRETIAGSRALVLASFAEGLPVVLMEALAMGRPAISTYVGGIPELVEPGRSGWLVPAGSADLLAQAIRAALDTPAAVLDEMGQRGAHQVAALHDSASEAGKLAGLIEAAIAAPAVAAPPPGPSSGRGMA